jgi:RNA polymerase sigma-70 factor (ECF subfamily)
VPSEIERLYREHRDRLVRLVERELRDHDDAEDVVQTAFLDAQRALERGTIPRNPHAWLAAIALNAAHRLRRRRLKAEPLEEYAVQEAVAMSEIRAALGSLPKQQRVAVLYRDVLGLSYDETAEQMGTSVNAVTMLLHRGRQQLRETLGVTAGGPGLWRWWKRAGLPQAAVAKGAAAVFVSTGLVTAGIVAARAVAPIGTDVRAAALSTRSGNVPVGAGRSSGGAFAPSSARRRARPSGGSTAGAAPALTRASTGAAKPASVRSGTSPSTSPLRLPTVSLPALTIPTLPAAVTVSTPIATVTVTTPAATTVTVPTPITTVTLPIP